MQPATTPQDPTPAPPVNLTPKAVQMVKLTRQEEGLDASHGLRVAVVDWQISRRPCLL